MGGGGGAEKFIYFGENLNGFTDKISLTYYKLYDNKYNSPQSI